MCVESTVFVKQKTEKGFTKEKLIKSRIGVQIRSSSEGTANLDWRLKQRGLCADFFLLTFYLSLLLGIMALNSLRAVLGELRSPRQGELGSGGVCCRARKAALRLNQTVVCVCWMSHRLSQVLREPTHRLGLHQLSIGRALEGANLCSASSARKRRRPFAADRWAPRTSFARGSANQGSRLAAPSSPTQEPRRRLWQIIRGM